MFFKGSVSKAHSKISRIQGDGFYDEFIKAKGKEIPGLMMEEPNPVPINHETNIELSNAAHEEGQKKFEEIAVKRYLKEEKEKQERIALELAKKNREEREKKVEEDKKPKEVTMESVPSDCILAEPKEEGPPTKESVAEEMEVENHYPQAEPSMKGKKMYYTQVMADKSINRDDIKKRYKKK